MESKKTVAQDPLANHSTIINLTEEDFRRLVVHQFRLGRERMDELHSRIDENTALTRTIAESTTEMVEIFKGAKTGATVFAWVGRNLRSVAWFLSPFITLAAALWAMAHGHWPKLGD